MIFDVSLTAAEAATTVPPELRHPSVPELGCRANGRNYVDGEAVPSKDACGEGLKKRIPPEISF
jgi:hypothetical protein